MPLFKHILSSADLPPVQTAFEVLTFDMKSSSNALTVTPLERAKDVAAFANATGGVILIGAEEDKPNARLGVYKPMDEATAAAVMKGYEEAVRDRCRPPPAIDVQKVPKDGGFIVAINVEPFPGAAVGVRAKTAPSEGKEAFDAYLFPLRVGTQTNWLGPEHLPMLMLPLARRNAVVLENIPKGKRGALHFPLATGLMRLDFVEVRPMENTAVFRGSNLGGLPSVPCHVPLDAIRTIWVDKGGEFHIDLDGSIVEVPKGELQFLVSDPGGASLLNRSGSTTRSSGSSQLG